ncbi:16S rRNA (cytosine(967)-C(5))-methyltransferase RsmB [soil metagenome]
MTAPQGRAVPDGRSVAARALIRVERDGAFAAAALDTEIERAPQLSGRDRAFATELLYGTLRVLPWLRTRIDARAKHPLSKQPLPVRAALLLGAYQLYFARVPAFAAVDAAVEGVRAELGREVAGFVNAVLRRVGEDAAAAKPSREEALFDSCPEWLRASLAQALGEPRSRAFLAAGEPSVGLRVRFGVDRTAALEALRAAKPDGTFEPGRASPFAITAHHGGRPRDLPGVREGSLFVQEEGSQVIALALGAQVGETVLDACAGRGNKTALLAEIVGPTGAVDACDLHENKLERMKADLAARGTPVHAIFGVDWAEGTGDVPEGYDRVLVDAPCSGIGTLRRRPDLLLRREAESITELQTLQHAILLRASTRVRPGGTLVYAVCSVLGEECEAVVDRFLESAPDFASVPFSADFPVFSGNESALRLTPEEHGTDGYYLACLRRVANQAVGA